MLSHKIFIGALASFFWLGLAAPGIAGDYGKGLPTSEGKITSQNTANDNIEFDYSPREESNSIADYFSTNMDSETIEFDYSPREEHKNLATHSTTNSSDDDIQFDYSPLPTNCESPYC